ncbi:MAG: universal stress protein, partial [Halobacteriales archaeon]|nr:universal stress protein [Halobacteriales archaeon]
MYDAILLPTDGSEGTRRAEDHAIQLAVEHDAALHVLHIVNVGAIPPEVGADRVAEALETAGEAAIAEVTDRATDAGVESVTGVIEHGSPHREILQYAEDNGIDLTVM